MAPLKILQRTASLALAVAVLMAVILVAIPDGNDYALASIDKHARLDKAGKKLVFVGGSNLAYGLDSPTLERALGYTVVNMGMNAYLGVRFLMDEVEPSLNAGDVVVLSVENDAFRVQPAFDGVEGRTEDLLMMVKVRPASWAFISAWSRRGEIVAAIPGVVHRKTLRLINDAVHRVAGRTKAEPLDLLERRGGFNAYGDLVSHIDVTWREPREPGLVLAKLPAAPDVARLLGEYRERWARRGIRVFVVPPPVPTPYYEAEKQALTSIRADIEHAMPGAVIAPIERYVFPDSCFFDDIHHLNGECRLRRTDLLAEDLSRALGVTRRAR